MRLRVRLVGLCLGQCVSAPVYLSVSFSPPPPFRAEDQTQGLGCAMSGSRVSYTTVG